MGNKWQPSDKLWGKMAPITSEHKTRHPLGIYRKRIDNRAAMDAIFLCSEPIVSGMRSTPLKYVHPVLLIADFRNGMTPSG